MAEFALMSDMPDLPPAVQAVLNTLTRVEQQMDRLTNEVSNLREAITIVRAQDVATKLEKLDNSINTRFDRQDSRIIAIERFQWQIVGAVAFITAIAALYAAFKR